MSWLINLPVPWDLGLVHLTFCGWRHLTFVFYSGVRSRESFGEKAMLHEQFARVENRVIMCLSELRS
jgi:hypothetical protein